MNPAKHLQKLFAMSSSSAVLQPGQATDDGAVTRRVFAAADSMAPHPSGMQSIPSGPPAVAPQAAGGVVPPELFEGKVAASEVHFPNSGDHTRTRICRSTTFYQFPNNNNNNRRRNRWDSRRYSQVESTTKRVSLQTFITPPLTA